LRVVGREVDRCHNLKMLSPGTPAPDFELPDQNGDLVRLRDLAGSWVLLWWYPKAATPG
jgi:peroxiredoxin Q/BCP